jgi:hypothetical protein
MPRDINQVPTADLSEQSAVPLLKSLGVLLIAMVIAIAIAPYTMQKPILREGSDGGAAP